MSSNSSYKVNKLNYFVKAPQITFKMKQHSYSLSQKGFPSPEQYTQLFYTYFLQNIKETLL